MNNQTSEREHEPSVRVVKTMSFHAQHRWASDYVQIGIKETTMSNILSVAGPNSKYKEPDAKPAGFLAGLWHGLMCPVTFLIGLFSSKVRMYEVNNKGSWYDFGFLIGASGSIGSGGASA